MQVQEDASKRSRSDGLVHLQHVSPMIGKGLSYDVGKTQLISRIFEGHDVMRIARNGLSVLARRNMS